jgi:high-affinity iron transporter
VIKNKISLLLIAIGCFTFNAIASTGNQGGYIIHLLTYLASDYAGAVQDGKIVSNDEYKEMVEFAESIDNNVNKLEIDESLKSELKTQSKLIKEKVANHENQSEIAPICEAMKKAIIAKLNVEIAPLKYPSISNGKDSLCEPLC